MSTWSPRRPWHSSITAPTYPVGAMTVARMKGSPISSIDARIGHLGRAVDVDHLAADQHDS